ncbi:hypothetical protein QJ857_gp0382 [Tupanvirus soda lake]|uniref:Uncharacterized protein n=1 Tax=Tupanvirus deep ocean TaxID=2126984 RepID=A0AC59HC23_9VIRU|nr:hypothetical protein QJ857_gp0382 [Tupanvirus soda lake]AUL78496.2 hypothetical protein [Tupanvirus soda lake]
MNKYYIAHAVIDPQPEKILKILKDGFLLPSSESGKYGLFHGEKLDHVYFSLFGDEKITFGVGGVSFILSSSILFEKQFRYALAWVGNDLDKTILVDYRYDNVIEELDKINQHIISVGPNDPRKFTSHEILIKHKVDLHKYMVAMCCKSSLTDDIIEYIKIYYPNIIILDKYPDTAKELTNMLYKHKYKKYKLKYLNLKKEIRDNQFEHDFYFLHSTTRFDNLLDVLKIGCSKN